MQDFATPMMKQYVEIKQQYLDCLLFYRMGDFYELFMDDAFIGAKILDITLTSKPGGKDGRIPMAGVPYHAVDSYLAKLVKAGYKVAICEQVSEPDKYGIVDREVIRIVTPGTVLDEKALEKKENNYIISLAFNQTSLGIAVADISTGLFQTTQIPLGNIEQILTDELTRINPTECILSEDSYNNPHLLKILKNNRNLNIYCFKDWNTFSEKGEEFLKNHFKIKTVSTFYIEDKPQSIEASAALLGYLQYTQKSHVDHFTKITHYSVSDYLILDKSTIVNLELFSTLRDKEKKGSLISIIDNTITAMGGRMIRNWLQKPLMDQKKIEKRYELIEHYLQNTKNRKNIIERLNEIGDIERILSRLSVGIGNARDLANLKYSLQSILKLKSILKINKTILAQQIHNSIDGKINYIIELIDTHIIDNPPINLKEGGIIKESVNQELDHLRKIVNKGKSWIVEMEEQERKRTGITSLKVRFNKVFGFYIEVSNANINSVPKDYTRKQTLVNGERFITPELKEQELLILSAEEKINKLEYQLFTNILQKILICTEVIQKTANAISALDCIISFTILAEKEQYCRPTIINTGEINIIEGRHPVVEKLLDGNEFVPNNILLNHKEKQLLLITGPNMAGKSVFIRQVALISLMAQMGSYVPAKQATISLVDRIFVRSGASDVITSGLSTFMVEMVETAQILNHATKNSLIIMDEIGRGTSTYDGISIAWAVAEYLITHTQSAAKTLFATHYHELQELEKDYPTKLQNFHMAVEEHEGEPVFLHTIIAGGASHSFGIAVAKIAGIPDEVIKKATTMLHMLETRNTNTKSVDKPSQETNSNFIDHLLIKELENVDISQMTPLQALNKLAELKDKIKLTQISNESFLKAD